jgi:hypothetical protein
MAQSRNQLSIEFPKDGSQGTPVLFMRAENGRIFEIKDVAGKNSVMDDQALTGKFDNLLKADFDRLVDRLGAGGYVTEDAPQKERVNEFMKWAKSPAGLGLDEVYRLVKEIIPNFDR